MIDARAAGPDRSPALLVAVGCATVARVLIGGAAPAASVPAALVFATILTAAVVLGGARPTRLSWQSLAIGGAGGTALIAVRSALSTMAAAAANRRSAAAVDSQT